MDGVLPAARCVCGAGISAPPPEVHRFLAEHPPPGRWDGHWVELILPGDRVHLRSVSDPAVDGWAIGECEAGPTTRWSDDPAAVTCGLCREAL
jgi:hypothetical protein